MNLGFLAFALSFVVSVLVFVETAGAQSVARAPARKPVEVRLFDGKDVLKMTEQEQDEYLEALRDFMDKRQYRAPSFSEYFMDIVMGRSVAQADNSAFYNGDCIVNGQIKNSNECRANFLARARSGAFGECTQGATAQNGSSVEVKCGSSTFQFPAQPNQAKWPIFGAYENRDAERRVREAVTDSQKRDAAYDEVKCSREIRGMERDSRGTQTQISQSRVCFNRFLEQVQSGRLGDCSGAYSPEGSNVPVTKFSCTRKDAAGKDEVTAFRIENTNEAGRTQLRKAITDSRINHISHTAPANDNIPPVTKDTITPPAGSPAAAATAPAKPGDTAPAAPASTSPAPGTPAASTRPNPAADPTKSDGPTSARCFYAGFTIGRADKKPCEGLTDLCATNNRMKDLVQSDLRALVPCGTDAEKEKAKCGGNPTSPEAATSPGTRPNRSDTQPPPAAATVAPAATTTGQPAPAAPTIRNNSNQRNQVVCNPVLYGLTAENAVICVPRSSTSSSACASKANNDKLKELLKKKPHGVNAFGQVVDSINRECKPFWKVGATEITENSTAADRTDDTYKGDFKKTCKVLLERALEIGERIASDNNDIKEKVKVLRQAVAATGAPAATNPAPPAGRPTR